MFSPRRYEYSVSFSGSAPRAFAVARTALLSLGFELLVDETDEMQAEGPGMHSNQQPELLGVSWIKIITDGSAIRAVADLGGVAKMKTFLYLFPPGLALFLILTFALTGPGVSLWHAAWVLPWFFISPLMARSMEINTIRAVERLIRGMAQARE